MPRRSAKTNSQPFSGERRCCRQGVHILEYQNLEDLASDETYKFAYLLGVNKIKGATAGTVLRPIGMV
jgi:hypothetical protein